MENWVEAGCPGAERATVDDEVIPLSEVRAHIDAAVIWVDGVLLVHCAPSLAHSLLLTPSPRVMFINVPQALHVARFSQLEEDGAARAVRGQVMEKARGKLVLVEFSRVHMGIPRQLLICSEDEALLAPWPLGAGVVVIGRAVFGSRATFFAHCIRAAPRVYPALRFPPSAVNVDLGGPAATALCLSAVVSHSGLSPLHILLYGEWGEKVAQKASAWSLNAVWCSDSRTSLLSSSKGSLGGALALATDGVVVVQDATQMTKRVAELLAGELCSAEAGATCWMLWPKQGLSRQSQMNASQELRPPFPGLLSSLPLTFRLVQHDESFPNVSVEHAQRAASLMARNDMEISKDARHLLEGFVLRSREIRNTRSQEMPITALSVAISLAKAHACLCFRGKVHTHDAVVALWLLEESLVSSTGRSVIQFSRALPSGKSNLSMYNGLQDLEHHLSRFASSSEQ